MSWNQLKPINNVAAPAATYRDSDEGLACETQQINGAAKRCLDVGVVLAALLVLSPLIIFIAFSILILQGKPVLIKHRRLGRGGRPFLCLKFRTMVVNGDEVLARHIEQNEHVRIEWEMTRKIKNDPRVTPLGQVLRKTSVDELPQLLNILRGDMSLVGPRPIVHDEVVHYGLNIEQYYKVRPGLTGIWQISGRSDLSYKSRVSMDVEYINNHNITRDLIIIAKTIPSVLAARGSC